MPEDFQTGGVEYLPHLTLDESKALNDRVPHTSKGNRVWASGVVVCAIDVVIPHLTVTIQGADSVSIPCYAFSTEQPGAALVLIAHRKGVVQPVLNVLVPQEGALLVNIDVTETSCIHDRLDQVGLVEEHHLASASGVIVPAVLEGLNDRRRRVSAVRPGLHDTRVAGRNLRSGLRDDEGQLKRRRGKGLAHCERHDDEGLAAESHLALGCSRSSQLLYRRES